ncbi:MAG: HD domain-containing protein [Cloacibacillus sp.]
MFLKDSAFNVTKEILMLINGKLLDHGVRAAYILKCMLSLDGGLCREELRNALMLAVFHDVGANKTEEIDSLLSFETEDTLAHSVYGYLFLKYLSPLKDDAEVVLYHHMSYEESELCPSRSKELALKLHLADRVDICALGEADDARVVAMMEALSGSQFDPRDVLDFKRANERFHILENIRSGAYEADIRDCYDALAFTESEVMALVRTLVFAVDFRSEQTVLHTLQTANFASLLGERMGFDEQGRTLLYYLGLLHDIGKIKIPVAILEKPGALTPEEMCVMQMHVTYTRQILENKVAPEMVEIAARHHEKLNGAGYPQKLKAAELTLPQRIMAVADITSALFSRRSYRDKMPKESVVRLLKNMASGGLLDAGVVAVMTEGYDDIILACEINSSDTVRCYEALKNEFEICREEYLSGCKDIYHNSDLFFSDAPAPVR